jgi:hypothetical protein
LSEDTHARPSGIPTGMPCAELDSFFPDAIEVKNYLGVRELLDSVERLRSDVVNELDAR